MLVFSVMGSWAVADNLRIKVDAHETLIEAERAKLMGINIALYNNARDFEKAMKGPLGELECGLIRMPGGTQSDKYYWNGNGVVVDGKVDNSKFKDGYWEVDYSNYAPGFTIDDFDWGKAFPQHVQIDAKTMHEVTLMHPKARNLVTVNVGTGTPELAAEWVRWANIKNGYQVKYWELGNELNGSWEPGHIMLDGTKITAEIYVKRFVEFAKAMKAVDPTIMIGGPSCDVEHEDDYFEPLLRDAGEYVDFITLHYYSLRDCLAPEDKLFDGLANMTHIMERATGLVEKYIPERKDKIEYSITEWNSKLPKDQDAYRLFNGLWFSAWIGEMLKEQVDSATVWDMFSGKDNGHGLLVQKGRDYVPTGRYWGFWLWSNYMADRLVKTSVDQNEHLHVYATRNDKKLYVMVMNESRTDSYPVTIDIEGFKASGTGKEVTLSSREYFWNPYKGEADWNTGPTVVSRVAKDGMQVEVPPYCVKIYQFDAVATKAPETMSATAGKPELRLLTVDSGLGDMPIEGWVRAYEAGTDKPYKGDLDTVELTVNGLAELGNSKVFIAGAAGRFTMMPLGPGRVTLTAKAGDVEAQKIITFSPVDLENKTVWDFESGTMDQRVTCVYSYEIGAVPGGTNLAVRVDFPEGSKQKPGDHIFNIREYPKGIELERIGGVTFDLYIPEDFKCEDPDANLQFVLQSHNAYWVPCGQLKIADVKGKWQTFEMPILDKKYIKAMDKAFALIIQVAAEQPATGSLYLDDIGFILRPKK